MSDAQPPQPPPPPGGGPPPPPPPPGGLTPPPGYVGYGANPTPSVPLRRIKGLSTAVVVLIGAVVLANVASTFLTFSLQSDADNFLAGSISEDDFESSVAPLATVSFLSLAVTLAAAIVTIIWMYRVAANVRAFGRKTTFHPLFAVFGWVLPPLVNIVPFLMARELWKASEPGVVADDEWKRSPDNPTLWVWIVAYGPVIAVLTFLGTAQSGNLTEGGTEAFAESLQDFGALGVISTVLAVIGGAAWILFTRQLTDRHIGLTREA